MDYSKYFFEKEGKFYIVLEETQLVVEVKQDIYKEYKKMHHKQNNNDRKFFRKYVSLDSDTFVSTKYEYAAYIREDEKQFNEDRVVESVKNNTNAKLNKYDESLLRKILIGSSEGKNDVEIASENEFSYSSFNYKKKMLLNKIVNNKK